MSVKSREGISPAGGLHLCHTQPMEMVCPLLLKQSNAARYTRAQPHTNPQQHGRQKTSSCLVRRKKKKKQTGGKTLLLEVVVQHTGTLSTDLSWRLCEPN